MKFRFLLTFALSLAPTYLWAQSEAITAPPTGASDAAAAASAGASETGDADTQLLGPPNVETSADADPDAGATGNVGASPTGTSGATPGTTGPSNPVSNSNDPTLGAGIAGEPGNPVGTDVAALFERLDSNHDGALSRAEAKQDRVITGKFDRADRNRDGKLSDVEFRNIEQL